MRRIPFGRQFWVGLCVAALVAPTPLVGAEEAPAPTDAAAATGPPTQDVALDADGLLTGQVVDAGGAPMAGEPITLSLPSGKQVGVRTSANGNFAFRGVTGGVCVLETQHVGRVCRVWDNGAAPPAATNGVLLVSDPELVARGQYCAPGCGDAVAGKSKKLLANPLIVGGIIAAAVAIPVAIHNADDDDGPAS